MASLTRLTFTFDVFLCPLPSPLPQTFPPPQLCCVVSGLQTAGSKVGIQKGSFGLRVEFVVKCPISSHFCDISVAIKSGAKEIVRKAGTEKSSFSRAQLT